MDVDRLDGTDLDILVYVLSYRDVYGISPTVREIMRATDLGSTSVVAYRLERLCRRGWLRRYAHIPRGLAPTREALAWAMS